MITALGPVLEEPLLPGERVAIRTRRVLSRKGRCVVRVRIFGGASLGWLDSFSLWGACVEVFICPGGNVKHLVDQLYPDVYVAPWGQAIQLPPHRPPWHGILAGTITSTTEAEQLSKLVHTWQPDVVLITAHYQRVTRKEFLAWMPFQGLHYIHIAHQVCRHDKFGGVTNSCWRIAIAYRDQENSYDLSLPRMTAGLYARHLQTALDDTIGPTLSRRHLDMRKPMGNEGKNAEPIGLVNRDQPVYDSSGLGPDLAVLTNQQRHSFWILAVSVFSKSKVIRKPSQLELLAIWDYAGKVWYQGMDRARIQSLLLARLESPPGKILKTLSFGLCQQILEATMPKLIQDIGPSPGARGAKGQGALKSVMELKGIQRAKAALADDAGVELSYWALPNETPIQTSARDLLRRFAHSWWVMNLTREAYSWLAANGNHPRDAEAINECIKRAAGSDYWDWHRGSKLFFWRFPEECDWRLEARDGTELWHLEDPPKGLHFQNIPASTREGELQIRKKVFQLLFRWYLEKGPPDLVTPRFAVEKVADELGNVLDIRAVWDAKKNGLNKTLWCPKFSVPTTQDAEDLVVKWLLVSVGEYLQSGSPPQDYTLDQSEFIKSWQFDHDVAQQFNNFTLHKRERHSHGVRFIHTDNSGAPEKESFLQLKVLNFGCLANPYLATQGEERIMELAQGDPKDENNPFQYDRCWLNLPTAKNYDPSMPRVMLLTKDGELATRRVTFIDDLHGASRGKEGAEAKRAASVLARQMNHKGNQCAARKYGPPTLIPRPWNGIMTHTDEPYPVKGTTGKKWVRSRAGLQWVWDECGLPEDVLDPIQYIDSLEKWDVRLDTAELRKIAGLWIHLTELYTEGRCFLKGFFNALEAFRDDRDEDGWRLEQSMDAARELAARDLGDSEDTEVVSPSDYPIQTRATYQLVLHTHALRRLFNTEEPRVCLIRPMEKHMVRYACGDASAEGFAQAVQYPDLTIDERDGLWEEEISMKSSNLREALNIANHLIRDITAGCHDGCELWQATDNAVWSCVCSKGMSSVRHLFELLVKIKILCHEHNVFYHCFHISGERMIATGIDGLSRGDHESGIALGYDLRDFLPLDVGAFDYPDNQLAEWCKGWMGDDYKPPATAIEWFLEAQKPGVHIIAPPAAAALHTLKEVARGRHKRPRHVTYVIMIPRLLYQEEWRSRFQKEVDVWFPLLTGEYWPHSAFEPLMVGIAFPLYRTRPWLLRMERDKVVGLGRTLYAVSKESNLRVRDHLRELWCDPRGFIQSL